MPKGQGPKLHDAVANVPVEANKIYSLLPSTENTIMAKLNKKFDLKVTFFSQLVQKKYLNNSNPLYSDIEIDENSLMRLLVPDFPADMPITLKKELTQKLKISLNIKKKQEFLYKTISSQQASHCSK